MNAAFVASREGLLAVQLRGGIWAGSICLKDPRKEASSLQAEVQLDDVMVISFPGQRCGPLRRLGNS